MYRKLQVDKDKFYTWTLHQNKKRKKILVTYIVDGDNSYIGYLF